MLKSSKTNDDQRYGLSAAASFLACAESTVIRHADARRLPCVRDTSNKRLFALSDLRKFKRAKRLRNNRRSAQ